jgi:hypothetical protein
MAVSPKNVIIKANLSRMRWGFDKLNFSVRRTMNAPLRQVGWDRRAIEELARHPEVLEALSGD